MQIREKNPVKKNYDSIIFEDVKISSKNMTILFVMFERGSNFIFKTFFCNKYTLFIVLCIILLSASASLRQSIVPVFTECILSSFHIPLYISL